MNSKRRKRVRILGKILFVLYIGFIIYFYCFLICMGVLGRWILIAIIWSFLKKLKGSGIIEIK